MIENRSDVRNRAVVIGFILIALVVGSLAVWGQTQRQAAEAQAVTPAPTQIPTVLATIGDVPTPTLTSTPGPPPTATITPSPTITLTPRPVDYQPLFDALVDYLGEKVHPYGFDLGIAFVDIASGQTISINGETRHYALSTFKGPLAAYYLWQVERGLIERSASDDQHLRLMLKVSSNPDTTCVIERVGGIAAYNDWMASQGLTREQNFVLAWSSWPCEDDGYVPEPDRRISLGDAELGLPGGAVLLDCPPNHTRCDKAFAPLELAQFYARLARGEIIDSQSLAQWYLWVEKDREGSAIRAGLPDDPVIHAYVKNGFRAADTIFPDHFFHEAGIIDTGRGHYVLAVFMQGNPDWTGEETIVDVSRIVYESYLALHPGGS